MIAEGSISALLELYAYASKSGVVDLGPSSIIAEKRSRG